MNEVNNESVICATNEYQHMAKDKVKLSHPHLLIKQAAKNDDGYEMDI